MSNTNKLPEGSTWNKFIIENVTENKEIKVTFAADINSDGIPDKYQRVTVSAAADGEGSVDPLKNEIALGEDCSFTVTPGAGMALYQVKNGEEVLYTNTAENKFNGTFTVENVIADMELTFVFSVDTDGDGVPDLSEQWFTITMTHDDNSTISAGGKQDSVRVKIGNSATVDLAALTGYAIDTVTVDGDAHVNDGKSEPLNGTDWTSFTFENVVEDHTISVTSAESTDDTGVADKYKLKVTVAITGDGTATTVPMLVVYGHDVDVNIAPNEGNAVDSIEFEDTTYINNPDFGKVFATDSAAIDEAVSDPDVNELVISAPVSQSKEVQFDKPMTIDGGGNTVTQENTGKTFTMTQNSTVKDITIESTADNTEWHSSYGVQFYTGEHTVEDVKMTGGNAAMIINGATVNLAGTIDVSGNTFGGIEVTKGTLETLTPGVLNINGATIINTTEEYGKPTIWIDGEGAVNGADAFTEVQVPHGDTMQTHYYLDAENAVGPLDVDGTAVSNMKEAYEAVKDGGVITLKADMSTGGFASDGSKSFTLDLNGHTVSADDVSQLVGSTGTETLLFQIKKGKPVTIKNGKMTSTVASILIQNYTDLILDNVELIGSAATSYCLSNNFGNIVLKNHTTLTPASGKVAFDVYFWPDHQGGIYADGVNVKIEDSTVVVNGKYEYAKSAAASEEDFAAKCSLIVPSDYDLAPLAGYTWSDLGDGYKKLVVEQ